MLPVLAPMTEPDSPKPWPPREGKKFLLLWLAGLLVFAVLSRAGMMAANAGGTFNQHGRVVFVVFALGLHAWQAWLLFSGNTRRVLWTAIPLISLLAGDNYRLVPLLGVIAPILETALLARIRLRPWAWLLAGMGQVIVTQLGWMLINNLADSWLPANTRNSPLHLQIIGGANSGLWLLGEVAAAYVLAFWMPPITPGSRTASPPPPGSTGA